MPGVMPVVDPGVHAFSVINRPNKLPISRSNMRGHLIQPPLLELLGDSSFTNKN